MRCETFLARYDRLEPGRAPGLFMLGHLELCPSCRAEVARVDAAAAALRVEGPAPLALELAEDRAMAAIRLLPSPQRDFTLREWIVAGVVIALSMLLLPAGMSLARFDEAFLASFALPFSLVLGLAITAYSALFVGTHMVELQGFMDRHVPQHGR